MPENVTYVTELTACTAAKVTAMLCLSLTDVNVCACFLLVCNKLWPEYKALENRSHFFRLTHSTTYQRVNTPLTILM